MNIDSLVPGGDNPFLRYSPPMHTGWVRFIFHKYEKEPDDKFGHGIEIYQTESFELGFINQNPKHGPHDMVAEEISNAGADDQIAEVAKDLQPGFYEVVGEFWYEFDPGESTPNGPAEPEGWWWIEKAQFLELTEEQAEFYLPPTPPPKPQAWEHNTFDAEGDKHHHQCPSCKKWSHRCSSCSYMGWEEETYCSENCWKAAGCPTGPEE